MRKCIWFLFFTQFLSGPLSIETSVSQDISVVSIGRLAKRSNAIIVGKVGDITSKFTPDSEHIRRYITIIIDSALSSGTPRDKVTIEVGGGTVGSLTETISESMFKRT